MNFNRVKEFIAKKGAWPFVTFWLIGIFVISGRLFFDITTFFDGSALYYRGVSKSGYEYLLHLPKGYTDFEGPRPLIIYLHGAGETGISLGKLEERDLVHCTKGNIDDKDFPFIVISPVTEQHGWEPKRVVMLLDELLHDKEKRWMIDERRVYLTGMSMGGFGTFRTACEFPERFTAIAPVAGGGEPERARSLKDLPTWAFHGNADDVVPYENSAKMIEAMQAAGAKEAKLETLHGKGHGIMCDVYSKPELYRWMLDHERN